MDLLHTVANRVSSTVTSIAGSSMERRVNAALSSDSTIPSHTELTAIARQSINWSDYSEIIAIIQSNLKLPLKMNARLLNATLMLVEAMLVYGNTDILVDCRSWVPKISELEHARLIDDFGHDVASAIRMSAARCLHLIREPERLKEERASHQLKTNFSQSTDNYNYSGYAGPRYSSNQSENSYSSNGQYPTNQPNQSSYSGPSTRYSSPSVSSQTSGYAPPRIQSVSHSDNLSLNRYNSSHSYQTPSHSPLPNYSPNPYQSNGYGPSLNAPTNYRPRAASASHQQYPNSFAGNNNSRPASYLTPQPQPPVNQPSRPTNQSTNNADLSWMIEDRSAQGVPTLSPPPNYRSVNPRSSQDKLFDLDFLNSADSKPVDQSINQSYKQDEPPAFVPDYMKSVRPVDLASFI